MALDGVKAVGDDQEWKAQLERIIVELRREIVILKNNQRTG